MAGDLPNMKEISANQRRVENIYSAEFKPWVRDDGTETGESVLQLNNKPKAVGFHVYKMEPGTHSQPHEHTGDEEFLILSGELIDNDGTVYREGDLVWLEKGTQHNSFTETGCVIAVYIDIAEKNLVAESSS